MRKFAVFWASLSVVTVLLAASSVAIPAWARDTSSGGVVVTGQETPFGHVLFTANSRAVYELSFDTVGTTSSPAVSQCTGACTGAWPPLLAAGAAGPFDASAGVERSKLGTTQRPEGTFQVTYDGHPLYMFVKDTAPGQTNGENVAAFNGLWQMLTTGGRLAPGQATVSLEVSSSGVVLDTPTAFSTHHSLYQLTADPPNQTTCVDACATIWPPLLTSRRPTTDPGIARDDIGTLRRPDGSQQVTYLGHPLYLFAFDMAAGAPSGLTNGEYLVDAFAFGVWYLGAQSGVPNPGPVSIMSSSSALGTIATFASPNTNSPGPFTLYAFTSDTDTTSSCTDACARAWPPLLTSTPPTAASGSGISQTGLDAILRQDGTFQVTYFGHPLYLFSHAFTGTTGEGVSAFGGTFKVVSPAGALL